VGSTPTGVFFVPRGDRSLFSRRGIGRGKDRRIGPKIAIGPAIG
jgi:hypothetical protein